MNTTADMDCIPNETERIKPQITSKITSKIKLYNSKVVMAPEVAPCKNESKVIDNKKKDAEENKDTEENKNTLKKIMGTIDFDYIAFY